ncbi:hypothetical protein Q9966_000796, partial [Columba livia]
WQYEKNRRHSRKAEDLWHSNGCFVLFCCFSVTPLRPHTARFPSGARPARPGGAAGGAAQRRKRRRRGRAAAVAEAHLCDFAEC